MNELTRIRHLPRELTRFPPLTLEVTRIRLLLLEIARYLLLPRVFKGVRLCPTIPSVPNSDITAPQLPFMVSPFRGLHACLHSPNCVRASSHVFFYSCHSAYAHEVSSCDFARACLNFQTDLPCLQGQLTLRTPLLQEMFMVPSLGFGRFC